MSTFSSYLICPSSPARVNAHVVRIVGVLVCTLAVLFLWTKWLVVPLLFVFDFWVRGYAQPGWSPLRGLARQISTDWLEISPVLIPEAPKRFAARIGLFLSVLALGFGLIGSLGVASTIVGILAFFSALEGFFGICVGCYVYTFLVRVFGIS